MPSEARRSSRLQMHALTPDRWGDLVDLFGPERGANSGCWCLWPRLTRRDWKAMSRDARRAGLHAIVRAGPPPGILAYRDGTAVGWVAVGPRPSVAQFNGSRLSRPPDGDDESARIFAITCFYVRAGHRRQGLTGSLARAAIGFARQHGARALDVCAIDTTRPLAWGEGFVGIASAFLELGFVEIARRSPTRPLLRLGL